MRAVVVRRPGQTGVEEVELDAPLQREVLVRVATAGVCHSDVRFADGQLGEGRWPMVLGHEGAGVVEAVGDGVDHVAPGDRVSFCFVASCRLCDTCRAGRLTLCEVFHRNNLRGTLLDGTSRLSLPDGTPLQHELLTACFAERAVVPAGGAVPLPAGIPLWQAALVSCAVVTGFGAVRNAARVKRGESACVVGCGGVGLQVVAALRLVGADPIVAVDRDPGKLVLASRRGATHVVDASADEPVRAVRRAAGGGVDHAFEVVGRPGTMRLAWNALRPGATAIVVGLAPLGAEVSLPAIELLSEKGIRGSFYGSGDPADDIRELAGLAAEGSLELADVVTEFTGLDGVGAALGRLRRGEGARTVVVVDRELADAPASTRT